MDWESLPLLPLRCILEYLTLEDALSAMSTCQHWRNAVLLYEGHKETLELRTGNLEKNLFLTRLFRKNVRRLQVIIEHETDLDKFVNFVLPQYFDSTNLNEITVVGPSYVHQSHLPVAKLKRIITESLIIKHAHSIKKLSFLGCELATAKNENERYSHKHIEHYSKSLSFSNVHSPADALLSKCNTNLMVFSSLKHIIVDYEQVNTAALETLSNLRNFSQLSLNVVYKRNFCLKPIDWQQLNRIYVNGLDVGVNIISLPHRKFNYVIENVLVDGLCLTSLKVMFCKTLHTQLLNHVSNFQTTIRELVWVDSPCDSNILSQKVRSDRDIFENDMFNVNPFILLCWQCKHLKRLVIHGYWVWQYDLIGCFRLRKRLELQASAVYERDEQTRAALARLMRSDAHLLRNTAKMSKITEVDWTPMPFEDLHPALQSRSSHEQRMRYIMHETNRILDVT